MPISNPDINTVPTTLDICANSNIRVRNADGTMERLEAGQIKKGVPRAQAIELQVIGAARVAKEITKAEPEPAKPARKRASAASATTTAGEASGD